MPRKRKEILQLIRQTTALKSPVLDLSNCNLGDLLEQVCQMDWLIELNLAHCHLSSLPHTIGNLTRLMRLDLSENQLAALPESISRLTALRYLNLNRAGYEFSVSEELVPWLQNVPEVISTDNTPFVLKPAAKVFSVPDHPNRWLDWLRQALALYTDALSIEDRGFNGSDRRTEADASIAQIFNQLPELREILPEFYHDFLAQNFYSVNRDSEKTLDNNPFRLPTAGDDKWLATGSGKLDDLLPLRLSDETLAGSRRRILTLNTHTGQESEAFSCEYGPVSVLNRPYAEDEQYFADCEAWLYQSGPNRLYLLAKLYGYGELPTTKWFESNNSGLLWQIQARLTYEWLEINRINWLQLDYISRHDDE